MSTPPEGGAWPAGSQAAWTAGGEQLTPAPRPEALRYAPGGELGRGGMGVVWSATDTWLDRDIAVKRPRRDASAETLARMMREARLTARLVHPAIPPIYDVGEDEDGPFYTMPVLVGRTLHELLDDEAVGLRTLVDALARVSAAVGYAHARGVVHRDLKPANVLLGVRGEVWVVDWGVAFDPDAPDAAAVGTPGFAAPEQDAGGPVAPTLDVFALGRTLACVLAGRAAQAPALQAIAARCTETRPAARYPDGSAVAEELVRWLEGERVRAHRYGTGELLLRLVRRWRAPLAVAAAAVAIGGVLGARAVYAQRAERARADQALATSLAEQAAALERAGARPEAEVLAAHSLLASDNPAARGVLASARAAPALPALPPQAWPCARPFVHADGRAVCAGERLAVYGADGSEHWAAPWPADTPGEVVGARIAGELVLLEHGTNQVAVWAEGRRLALTESLRGSLGLARGPVPAIHLEGRLGRWLGEERGFAWSETGCERVETALVREEEAFFGCRTERLFRQRTGADPVRVDLPSSVSALAWDEGLVVGTFSGQWLRVDGELVGPARDTGVGAPRQLLDLGDGRVAILGEDRRAAVWDARLGVALAHLPAGLDGLAWSGEALRDAGPGGARFAVPEALVPAVLDRTAGGGLSFLDLSPSGERLLGGSATGEVVVWERGTGAARVLREAAESAALGGSFAGEEAVVYTTSEGMVRHGLGGEAPTPLAPMLARTALVTGEHIALAGWGHALVLAGDPPRRLELAGRPLALAAADTLWVAVGDGTVHRLEGEALVPAFTLPEPTARLALGGGRVFTARDETVEARSPSGELAWQWTWPGAGAITALAADEAHVAVGDLRGRVAVLDLDGALLARMRPHDRRVSALLLRERLLISASWDGFARSHDLAVLGEAPAAVLARAERTWGLDLDAALTGAQP